jgi:coproporphyrinogen III oxidase-like Fe-S oxidoreductase
MVGLRLREGIDLDAFARAYGIQLTTALAEPIAELVDAGYVRHANGHLRLTDRGRLVADAVLARLVSAEAPVAPSTAE